MKASIKAIFISAVASVTAFTAAVYTSSCNKDKCKTIVCANGGVCNSGVCTCPSGYEGSNCETVSRDKFIGNWSVFEKGTLTVASQYALTISKSSPITDVVITNFYNYFKTPVKGYVFHDTLYIPNQQYEGKVMFGIGYIYSNPDVTYGQYDMISMRYEIVDTATNLVNDFGYYAPDLSDPSAWTKQ